MFILRSFIVLCNYSQKWGLSLSVVDILPFYLCGKTLWINKIIRKKKIGVLSESRSFGRTESQCWDQEADDSPHVVKLQMQGRECTKNDANPWDLTGSSTDIVPPKSHLWVYVPRQNL